MSKKKKSNIIYKSAGFIALISVIIVIIIFAGNLKVEKKHNEFTEKTDILPNALGYETFENIKRGEAKIACNDAKQLSRLFVSINKELMQDNITDENLQQIAVSSPSKQQVDKFSKDLVDTIKENYSNDYDKAQILLQQITQEIYTNIVNTSIMIETGNISEKEFYDYIDITYCGVTPPATYISPHDIVIYSNDNVSGRGLIDELNDNISSDNLSK